MRQAIIRTWLLLTFFLPVFLYAQEATTSKSKKAVEAYNAGLRSFSLNQFSTAAQLMKNAIDEDPKFIEAWLVLAEIYQDWQKPAEAIETYRKGLPVNETFYPYGFVRLGDLEYRQGLYEEAKASYSKFLELEKVNKQQIEKAKDGIARSIFAIDAINNPVQFKPVNLGSNVNSTLDDYWPSLSADEKTLVITRLIPSEDLNRNVQEDFYISRWNDSSWSRMVNAGQPLNTSSNEGAQTITGDGRFMIFTACNRRDGLGRCDLYASEKEGDNWSVPYNLRGPVNTKYRETQPSLSADGRTLYFSSDRPGGKGEHDIWVSDHMADGTWSEPRNLGDTINSAGTEMSPFIHQDNQSLYFCSNGLTGLGGYDLFVSRRDSFGKWQKPVNLGYPINTSGDQIGLIVNSGGNKAYYSSDEKNAGKDIFMFDLPERIRPLAVTYMKGTVFDANTRRLLRADFELIDLETGKMIFKSLSDSITGEFLVSIPANRNYMLNVSKKDYLFFSENFSLKNIFNADKPYLKDVPLQPIRAGSRIILRNVFFETDSYALKGESKIELNRVVSLLQKNPGIKIEIGGHTDNTGNIDYNQKLSENRAKSVADYLVSEGIDAGRISWKGYGLNVPVATNETTEGRSQNRRTEMKVVE